MAKANEQWTHFGNENDVLVIYQGPHTYISPSNYEEPGVPTWNYSAIHMYGKASLVNDELELRGIITSLSRKYERNREIPWVPTYPDKMLGAIVGFKVSVERIEAKSKLSQNRSERDRANIIANLKRSGSEGAIGVAKMMEANELYGSGHNEYPPFSSI